MRRSHVEMRSARGSAPTPTQFVADSHDHKPDARSKPPTLYHEKNQMAAALAERFGLNLQRK